jgi:hypothetical protein
MEERDMSSMRANGTDLWFPEPLRWQIQKGRIAEVIEMIGNILRPMVSELAAAIGKIQIPAAPAATPSPDPVPTPAAPSRETLIVVRRESRDHLGRFLMVLFSGAIIALVAVVIMNHPWAIVPTATTTPAQPGTSSDSGKSSGSGGMVNSEVNHDGASRGWDVWNQTDETLDMLLPNGRSIGTLAPGGYQSFPCKNPRITVLFKGPSGFEHKLNHVFQAGEGWHQDVIKKT